jgi:hypothetical protein
MQLKIYLLALKEEFVEGLCLARSSRGAGVRVAVHECGGGGFAQGGQQTAGQGPVAMALSRAVFRLIDRLPPVKRAHQGAPPEGKDGATPQTPRSRERQVKA